MVKVVRRCAYLAVVEKQISDREVYNEFRRCFYSCQRVGEIAD